jgi:uncharacterized protein
LPITKFFLADQQWLTIGDVEFDHALSLRVRHKIKTPDAIHLATAIRHDCVEFWTNDERLRQAATGMAVNIFDGKSRNEHDHHRLQNCYHPLQVFG